MAAAVSRERRERRVVHSLQAQEGARVTASLPVTRTEPLPEELHQPSEMQDRPSQATTAPLG